MNKDCAIQIKNILEPSMDLVIGSILNVNHDDVVVAENRLNDLEQALAAKKHREKEYLEKAEEISTILERFYKIYDHRSSDTLIDNIILVLEYERDNYIDMASREHVEREEDRLRQVRMQLRIFRMKKELIDAVVARSGR